MAITVQYSPDAQLVAQAAMTAGQGDYNRWAAQQALNEKQLAQQKELTFFNAANEQYQQKIGVLDGQYRQTQQIAASQTEQLRNIANQQGLAQFDAANQNWRFGTGIASDQFMQQERLAVSLQQQQNDIQSAEFRQNQQLTQQNLSDIRNIEAQQQRTMAALQMERMNTLSQLQARQQSEQFQAQQQYRMATLDGQQRAGLMGLQSRLNSQQQQVDHANNIARMNFATKNQLDLSSTLADKEFRQKNFLDEYGQYYDTMSQREYEGAYTAWKSKNDAVMKWAEANGMANDPNVMEQIKWNMGNELMGIKARAPVYSDAEWKFKGGLVNYNGTKFMATDRGFEALPDPYMEMKVASSRDGATLRETAMKTAMSMTADMYRLDQTIDTANTFTKMFNAAMSAIKAGKAPATTGGGVPSHGMMGM